MADIRKTAYQYRLHLTKGQQRILEQQLEQCCWVYNQTLAARRDAWEQRQETLRLYDTQALLPDWKAERPSLIVKKGEATVSLSWFAQFGPATR
jgi:putative transposase